MPDATAALKLKDEGNALFGQKKFRKALEKYSAAIEANPENAVLYANRAACFTSLGRQDDALEDAKKATELDPKYVKAWSRLATAYQATGAWELSIEAWNKALDCLPADGSASATKQRTQYEEFLRQAKVGKMRIEESSSRIFRTDNTNPALGAMTWDRAAYLTLLWKRENVANSSAWVLARAYADFIQGNELMTKLTITGNGPNGAVTGWRGAIVKISNAITCDQRALSIDLDWVTKYNEQVKFEFLAEKAWSEGGPNIVMKEIKKRLSKEGWDSVRPALAITIRGWIVLGSVHTIVNANHAISLKFFTWAVELLQEGRKTWKDVSDNDRGAIFSDTFIRGVRRLHMGSYMRACADALPKCTLKRLYELAKSLYEDTVTAIPYARKDEPDINGSGFHLAFNVYPAAEALSTMALYHVRMAENLRSTDIQQASEHVAKAGPFYIQAADMYPPDDEQSIYLYCCAIDTMYRSGSPVKKFLPLLKKIRDNNPKMLFIWEPSSFASAGRDKAVNAMLKYEDEILEAIQKGILSEDDSFVPRHPDGGPISLLHDDITGTRYT